MFKTRLDKLEKAVHARGKDQNSKGDHTSYQK